MLKRGYLVLQNVTLLYSFLVLLDCLSKDAEELYRNISHINTLYPELCCLMTSQHLHTCVVTHTVGSANVRCCWRDPTLRQCMKLHLSSPQCTEPPAAGMSEAGSWQWDNSTRFCQSRPNSNEMVFKRRTLSCCRCCSVDTRLTQDTQSRRAANWPDPGCGFITFGHKSRLADFTPVL